MTRKLTGSESPCIVLISEKVIKLWQPNQPDDQNYWNRMQMNIALGTYAYDILFAQGSPLLSRQILIKFRSGAGAGQPHIMSGVWRNLGLNSFDEHEIVPGSVRHCQGIGRRGRTQSTKSDTKVRRRNFWNRTNVSEFRRVCRQWREGHASHAFPTLPTSRKGTGSI